MSRKSFSGTEDPPFAPQSVAEEEASKLETEFLALISHELRSPLTTIKGYAATLRRHGNRLGARERDEFLRAIGEASDRLDTTITRLLELSRLEAGALKPRLAPVDMVYLIREAITGAEQRFGDVTLGAGGHVFLPPDQEVLPLALVDRRLQREALDILLENAALYSPAGSVVRVMARIWDSRLIISVHDHGPGIPPDRLNRIFQRFSRVDTRLNRERGGAGIGLAMCKRIVELQGGDIWVESAVGVGSVFSMSLPLAGA
ncbi:MAG TPA: ATP-binding protein [Ktedonobacterales bacterium]